MTLLVRVVIHQRALPPARRFGRGRCAPPALEEVHRFPSNPPLGSGREVGGDVDSDQLASSDNARTLSAPTFHRRQRSATLKPQTGAASVSCLGSGSVSAVMVALRRWDAGWGLSLTLCSRPLASNRSAEQHAKCAGLPVQFGDPLTDCLWFKLIDEYDGIGDGTHTPIVERS